MKLRRKTIGCLIVFCFFISIITPLVDFTKLNFRIGNVKASTNYLFKDTTYNLTLDDISDDEDSYKLYTDSYFQSQYFNSSYEWQPIHNETVDSGTDNNEIQLGDPSHITMIQGTTGYEDEMATLDAVLTTFTSTSLAGTSYESPVQFGDFVFTKGSGGATDTLESNNGDFARIDPSFTAGGESLLGYIVPQSDITANWNEGDAAPHATLLDEAPADSNGDGGNIRETSDGVDDKWDFTTLAVPEGSTITKVIYHIYISESSTAGDSYTRYTTSLGHIGSCEPASISYVWKTFTWTGLSFTQDDLNAFWMNVEPMGTNAYAQDIEAVYVDVYTTSLDVYSCDYTITWDVTDPDLKLIHTLYYDYRTTVAVDCDLDIYNWDTTNWLELQSNTLNTYITGSYGLTDPYISDADEVKIRFQTDPTYASDFDMELDQIVLGYYTIPAKLEFSILTPFNHYNYDLLSIHIESHQKLDPATTINFSIWNYDTSGYDLISSSAETVITEKDFNSVSPDDYVSGSGVKLYWNGSNDINTFLFSIDYLLILITYKMDLWHEVSFDTLGLWKYRWEIHGSLSYTSWTNFEVVDPEPNFHAISESDVSTRWILQEAELVAVEDFHDDINTDYWNLVDVSNIYFNASKISTGDDKIDSSNPNYNFGTGSTLEMYEASYTKKSLIEQENYIGNIYLINNCTGFNQTLKIYIDYDSGSGNIAIYSTQDFNELTATWNYQPSTINYISSNAVLSTGWNYFDIGDNYSHFHYRLEVEDYGDFYLGFSKEETGYEPKFIYPIYKNYFGSGYTYMQTGKTELISLLSTDYGTHYTLSSGDYFEVDFQTSSDSQINLILYKDGNVQKSLVLSQSGNTNFNRHTAQILVSESLEFDQLKISSTFEDKDNVKIYDIKTMKYTLTGDYENFVVGSKRTVDVYLVPADYNLKISDYSSGLGLVDINITIPATNHYVYTPTPTKQCRITFHNPDDIPLIFTDYHVYVNRSLGGSYSPFTLLENIFSVDVGSIVYINVTDRLNALIRTYETEITPTTDYLDIELGVYQLQIKNLMEYKTTVDINNNSYRYPLLSGDSLYFILVEANYWIGYYDSNGDYKQFTIYLNDNQAYELNRSKICFLAFINQKGEHLYFDNYKTYINGTLLYENIFYKEIGDKIGIEVKDLYDISVKNQTYTVISGDNYIPVVLTLYSLKVMSLQLVFNHINITRDPVHYYSPYYWSEWLAPRETAEYFLFAGYYVINITNYEDGGWSKYDYTLNGDDYILIGSNNTIYNVLVNLANVNTTIGNQITNVYIDLTNQNSNINNTIINIEINLGNINSTLGSLLINIDTAISNINSSIISEIVSLGTELNNINSSITNEILSISADLTNVNSSIISQILTLGVDISNINGSIINQVLALGVDVSNINTSLSNQILSIGVDISNVNTSITNQILLMIADISNVNASIINQTLVILSDITNMNSTLLNQMVSLGVDITNINASIINQILSLQVDLTNINSSISNLLTNIGISITNLQNDITTFYAFTNTSFINLNNVMNTSFINIENNIFSINQSISNLVIGVNNDLYLINGTITTMISQLETNLLLMNISIDTALFNLGTNLNLIGSNITTNYILLNNTLNLMDLNINDSRIAIINNLLLINNTISTLIADVYSAVYLVNNSIYTAVVDLGTYLSLMNNTIYGNLSIVLKRNEFLSAILQKTLFSDLLNWTNIGLNTSLLTSQIDAWEFINNYKNQSIQVFLRYQGQIEDLTISAQNTLKQFLPKTGTEYRLWSESQQEYLNDWEPLPENKTVDFGFFEEIVPYDPTPIATTYLTLFIGVIFFVGIAFGVIKLNNKLKERKNPIPPEVLKYMNKANRPRKHQDGAVDNRI